MSTSPVIGASSSSPTPAAQQAPHFLADVYTFNWSALRLTLSLISASSVALCLRHAYCTTFGAIIALLPHLDVLLRSRSGSEQ